MQPVHHDMPEQGHCNLLHEDLRKNHSDLSKFGIIQKLLFEAGSTNVHSGTSLDLGPSGQLANGTSQHFTSLYDDSQIGRQPGGAVNRLHNGLATAIHTVVGTAGSSRVNLGQQLNHLQ